MGGWVKQPEEEEGERERRGKNKLNYEILRDFLGVLLVKLHALAT
jgi:hypothetical protein